MFKKYDKVIIKGMTLDYIGGMVNHMTTEYKKEVFDGLILSTSSYWGNELKGDIMFIGKDNYYIIRSGNNYYVFCNIYNEMRLQDGI